MLRRYTILALSFVFALGACSGSDDSGPSTADARAAAPLDTAEDVLATAAYLKLLRELDDAAATFGEFRSPFAAKALNIAQKLTVAGYSCPEGGTLDYDDSNSDDYIELVFKNCVDDDGSQLHGQLVLECFSGDFSSDSSCANTLATFGTGSRSLKYSEPSGFEIALLGTFQIQDTGNVTITNQTLTVAVEPDEDDIRILGVTNGLQRDSEPDGNDGHFSSVSGDIGFAFDGDILDCISGTVRLSTLDQLHRDASGSITAGRLRITNANNQIATISFDAEGGATVDLNGSTSSFSVSEVRGACTSAD